MPDMMRILYSMAEREAIRSPEKRASRGARVAVYGGANLDIQARSRGPYRPADSNPGSVSACPGGVGRNIAENLARLGLSVELVAALGDDAAAAAVEASCRAAGIRVDRSLRLADEATPQYICVLDHDGRLVGAVAAMDAMDRFGPAELTERLAPGDEAGLVILDANLPEATIRAAAERWKDKPLLLDPVSVAKAVRAAQAIGLFSAVKPNLAEAQAILGAQGLAAPDAAAAARGLLGLGVGEAFVSLGARGLLWAGSGGMGIAKPPRMPVVNVSGAGDAATAALAWACFEGLGTKDKAALAVAAASLCAAAPGPVDTGLSVESLLEASRKVEHEPVS